MNDLSAYNLFILQLFFNHFQKVRYRGVPVSTFVYYPFLRWVNRCWNLSWAKQNLPCLSQKLNQLVDSEVFRRIDEPYPFDVHPGGIFLMTGWFCDIAPLYLQKERFILISSNQTETNQIFKNHPDLNVLDIEGNFHENSTAIEMLNHQISQVVKTLQADPIFGGMGFLLWLQNLTPGFVRIVDAVYSLFEKYPVSGVLTITTLEGVDCALNLAAKANRIPSITLQHGVMADSDLLSHIPVMATQKMVWGSTVQKWYQKYGYPSSRICVIGSPRFDQIHTRQWGDKHTLCQRLGIDPALKIMVYATQPLGMAATNAPIVLDGLKSIPEVFLLILLHRVEDALLPQYQKLCRGYFNLRIFRFGELSLYEALSGADIFITCFSTAALEAMILNLPVITVEPVPPKFSYGEHGASLKVSDSHELNQAVCRLLTEPTFKEKAIAKYQRFLSEYCVTDGLASKRLFEQVESLCRTGRNFLY